MKHQENGLTEQDTEIRLNNLMLHVSNKELTISFYSVWCDRSPRLSNAFFKYGNLFLNILQNKVASLEVAIRFRLRHGSGMVSIYVN